MSKNKHFLGQFSGKVFLTTIVFLALFAIPAVAFIDTDVVKLKGDPPRVSDDSLAAMQLEAISGNPAIDALLSGYQWPASTVTYSFYSDAVFGGNYYGDETVSEVSETVKAHFRQIFEWLGNVVGIEFQEVTESAPGTYGVIRIMLSSGPSYAYAYFPSLFSPLGVPGDIHLNPAYQHATNTNGWETPPGYHGYLALVHELGHALGLKHTFEGDTILPIEEENQSHTVMSYNFSANEPATYMSYDVRALQYLYSAFPYQAGRSRYRFDANIDRYRLGTNFLFDSDNNLKQAIWDSGGTDTLDLSALEFDSDGYRIDIAPGGWLTKQTSYNTTTFSSGTALCFDALLENVITSSSNDTIFLNQQPNRVRGYLPGETNGNDRIEDADARDTIDLTGFRPAEVIQNKDGDDLVLDLNGSGTIRIVDYYAENTPRIVFATSLAPVYHLLME